MEFREREDEFTIICLSVPAGEAAKMCGLLREELEGISGSLPKRWSEELSCLQKKLETDEKTNNIIPVTFRIDSHMQIRSVEVPEMLKAEISYVKPDGKIDAEMWVWLGSDTLRIKTKLINSTSDGENCIQISNLELCYEQPPKRYECSLSGEWRQRREREAEFLNVPDETGGYLYGAKEMEQIKNDFIGELAELALQNEQ